VRRTWKRSDSGFNRLGELPFVPRSAKGKSRKDAGHIKKEETGRDKKENRSTQRERRWTHEIDISQPSEDYISAETTVDFKGKKERGEKT